MAKDLCFNLVLLITLILDLVSSLYLSQESTIKNVGDTFIVICKDKERGLPVSWRGPKNIRLGQKTRPKVQTSSFGTAIMFNNAREEDSGNYTCSTSASGPIQEMSVFSLKVEAETTTDTEFIPVTFTPTEETYVIPQVITNKIYRKTHHRTEAPTEEVHVNPLTTELVETTEIIETTEYVEKAEIFSDPKEDIDVTSTTVETVVNTFKATTTEEEPRGRYKHKNNHTTNKDNKKVKGDPLMFKDTLRVQYLTEGDNAGFLRCETNKKDATINWLYQNKSAVASANNSLNGNPKYEIGGDGLIIRNVSRHDAGTYLCEAIHGSSGGLEYKEITVIVQHKPSAVVMAEVNVVYGFLNEIVNLTCEVEAVPVPRFMWSMEGANVDLSNNIINASSHMSVLQVNVTKDYDTPIGYKCVARNKMGEEDIYFTVQLGVLPDTLENATVLEATSDSLAVEIWVPEPSEDVEKYEMEPTYIVVKYREKNSQEDWMTVQIDAMDINETVTANLTDLKKSTTYDIEVATKNVVGLSEFFKIEATTSSATSVQAIMLILVMSVFVSILLPEGMRKA